VANTEKVPAIDDEARSDSRPKEALFYFKAGSYKATYAITLVLEGVAYQWYYETPDNSVAANEAYIKTDALCYALYNAMVTDPVNSVTVDLEFNIQRSGSLMRIWREDDLDFEIDVSDGLGNTQLLGFKEKAGGFDKLPQGGFDGMILKIAGDASLREDDYYVQYVGQSATGVWEECAAPDIPIAFDPATMPFRLISTAPDTFTFGPSPWGERVVGDEESSKDPSFVGKPVVDLAFDNARLMIESRVGAVWSRTNNPYVFFKDSVQVKLATDPVDDAVKASKEIAIMSTVLQLDDDTFLWAEGRQFRVSTADQPFTSETVAIKPSSAYDFNPLVPPLPIGRSVFFATENGPWTTITDILVVDGSVQEEEGITDHVPQYLPKNLRWLKATDTSKKSLAYSADTPTRLYLYEWRLTKDRERIQSAWSTWRLPEANSEIISAVFDRNTLHLVIYRPGGTWLLKLSVSPFQKDSGADDYLTRLDMRVSEADIIDAYDEDTNETSFQLPYLITDDRPYVLAVRTSAPDHVARGTSLNIIRKETVDGHTVLYVSGDYEDLQFYGGYSISAERTESQFFIHDAEERYVHLDRVQVGEISYTHNRTAYYRIEVLNRSGEVVKSYPFEGRVLGDSANVLSQIVLNTGSHRAPINQVNDQFRVRVVNDTFLPSAWQTAIWGYTGQ